MAATPTSPFLRTSEHERAKEKTRKKIKIKISAPKEKDPSLLPLGVVPCRVAPDARGGGRDEKC